ncbi:peptide chain release factor N(5)-glutamine methyltransferase [Patescibacteria group bacterium]|nr:peptide chain release factor N(5)-glutamine methyltransferase [Patescibacteria group bacterium]
MTKSRQLSIYEKNQLLRYGLKEDDLLARAEMPVEYLTGFVNFKNLEIKVNQNVLIPRVETEELIDLITNFIDSIREPLSCLEVGTGSGAISLALFDFLSRQKNLLLEKFILTDLSIAALKIAKENFSRLFGAGSLSKIQFLENDLLSGFLEQKFNLIVANLPYVPSGKMADLDLSVKDYEPILALNGGESGFELINKMLEQVLDKELLSEKGQIFLEVYENHNIQFIKKKFPKIFQNFSIRESKDQFNRQRFLILQKI